MDADDDLDCDDIIVRPDDPVPWFPADKPSRLKRRRRCGECGPCQVKANCGECPYCVRRTVLKQSCMYRKCIYLRKPVVKRSSGSGNGQVRNRRRFLSSDDHPVKDGRFLCSGGHPVTEGRFSYSDDHPVKDGRFLDSTDCPVTERIPDHPVKDRRFSSSQDHQVKKRRRHFLFDTPRSFPPSLSVPDAKIRYPDDLLSPSEQEAYLEEFLSPPRDGSQRYRLSLSPDDGEMTPKVELAQHGGIIFPEFVASGSKSDNRTEDDTKEKDQDAAEQIVPVVKQEVSDDPVSKVKVMPDPGEGHRVISTPPHPLEHDDSDSEVVNPQMLKALKTVQECGHSFIQDRKPLLGNLSSWLTQNDGDKSTGQSMMNDWDKSTGQSMLNDPSAIPTREVGSQDEVENLMLRFSTSSCDPSAIPTREVGSQDEVENLSMSGHKSEIHARETENISMNGKSCEIQKNETENISVNAKMNGKSCEMKWKDSENIDMNGKSFEIKEKGKENITMSGKNLEIKTENIITNCETKTKGTDNINTNGKNCETKTKETVESSREVESIMSFPPNGPNHNHPTLPSNLGHSGRSPFISPPNVTVDRSGGFSQGQSLKDKSPLWSEQRRRYLPLNPARNQGPSSPPSHPSTTDLHKYPPWSFGHPSFDRSPFPSSRYPHPYPLPGLEYPSLTHNHPHPAFSNIHSPYYLPRVPFSSAGSLFPPDRYPYPTNIFSSGFLPHYRLPFPHPMYPGASFTQQAEDYSLKASSSKSPQEKLDLESSEREEDIYKKFSIFRLKEKYSIRDKRDNKEKTNLEKIQTKLPPCNNNTLRSLLNKPTRTFGEKNFANSLGAKNSNNSSLGAKIRSRISLDAKYSDSDSMFAKRSNNNGSNSLEAIISNKHSLDATNSNKESLYAINSNKNLLDILNSDNNSVSSKTSSNNSLNAINSNSNSKKNNNNNIEDNNSLDAKNSNSPSFELANPETIHIDLDAKNSNSLPGTTHASPPTIHIDLSKTFQSSDIDEDLRTKMHKVSGYCDCNFITIDDLRMQALIRSDGVNNLEIEIPSPDSTMNDPFLLCKSMSPPCSEEPSGGRWMKSTPVQVAVEGMVSLKQDLGEDGVLILEVNSDKVQLVQCELSEDILKDFKYPLQVKEFVMKAPSVCRISDSGSSLQAEDSLSQSAICYRIKDSFSETPNSHQKSNSLAKSSSSFQNSNSFSNSPISHENKDLLSKSSSSYQNSKSFSEESFSKSPNSHQNNDSFSEKKTVHRIQVPRDKETDSSSNQNSETCVENISRLLKQPPVLKRGVYHLTDNSGCLVDSDEGPQSVISKLSSFVNSSLPKEVVNSSLTREDHCRQIFQTNDLDYSKDVPKKNCLDYSNSVNKVNSDSGNVDSVDHISLSESADVKNSEDRKGSCFNTTDNSFLNCVGEKGHDSNASERASCSNCVEIKGSKTYDSCYNSLDMKELKTDNSHLNSSNIKGPKTGNTCLNSLNIQQPNTDNSCFNSLDVHTVNSLDKEDSNFSPSDCHLSVSVYSKDVGPVSKDSVYRQETSDIVSDINKDSIVVVMDTEEMEVAGDEDDAELNSGSVDSIKIYSIEDEEDVDEIQAIKVEEEEGKRVGRDSIKIDSIKDEEEEDGEKIDYNEDEGEEKEDEDDEDEEKITGTDSIKIDSIEDEGKERDRIEFMEEDEEWDGNEERVVRMDSDSVDNSSKIIIEDQYFDSDDESYRIEINDDYDLKD